MLKIGLIFSTVTIIVAVSVYILKKQKDTSINKKSKKTINKVLFFRENGQMCSEQHQSSSSSCKLPNCWFSKLTNMIFYIDSAEETLDVCLFLLTVKSLGQSLVRAHNRGVCIRLITDEESASSSGSQIILLRKNGLNVRMKKSAFLMHHKFVIVDNSLILTGSLNWTTQAICGNWENLIITNQNEIVQQFYEEFNYLWENFKS